MKKYIFIFILSLFFGVIDAQSDKKAYRILDEAKKEVKWNDFVNVVQKADVILFGELHNNPIVHWLEYELTKDLQKKVGGRLVLGAEMFEADNQLIMDEYLGDLIKQKNFEEEMRLWNNYSTDYKPLVEFAKEKNIRFVATNVPRRYAAYVHAKGLDALQKLSEDAKKYIAPLPIVFDSTLACYKNMLNMSGHKASITFAQAQAIKDATMAYFIMKNWKPGILFLHFNGAYHSDNFEGIGWYLRKAKPDLKIQVITSIEVDDVNQPDVNEFPKASFYLLIPTSMTKTY